MNICGRLLLTAAAALALPIVVRAAPPVVIGDGSVCMDSGDKGKPFPAKGNTHAQRVTIVQIIIDTPGAKSACAPQTTCKGAKDCTQHTPTEPVVVFYADTSAGGKVPSITVTYDSNATQLDFALGGADWSDFVDLGGSGRQRIIRKTASIDRVLVSGKPAKCRPCRVTFVGKQP